MIEFHEPATDEENIGIDPYRTPVDDVTRHFLDDNSRIIALLERVANFSDRQREKVAPTVIDLSPSAGNPIANQYVTTARLRIEGILLTGGTGDKFNLSFGSRVFSIFNGGQPYFLFPYEIDRGIDIKMADITNPSSVLWSCYLFAYPE